MQPDDFAVGVGGEFYAGYSAVKPEEVTDKATWDRLVAAHQVRDFGSVVRLLVLLMLVSVLFVPIDPDRARVAIIDRPTCLLFTAF